MSARREKRLRKLEKAVEAQEKTIEAQGKRIMELERLAASPVTVVSAPTMQKWSPSFLARMRYRWKVWKFRRAYMRPGVTPEEAFAAFNTWKKIDEDLEQPVRRWRDRPSIEDLKKHPPKPFS